jgi:hypothetical protein
LVVFHLQLVFVHLLELFAQFFVQLEFIGQLGFLQLFGQLELAQQLVQQLLVLEQQQFELVLVLRP